MLLLLLSLLLLSPAVVEERRVEAEVPDGLDADVDELLKGCGKGCGKGCWVEEGVGVWCSGSNSDVKEMPRLRTLRIKTQ